MISSTAAVYRRFKDLVEEHIMHFIPEIDPISKDLYNVMKYALTGGGKRIRPVLVLAACDMFNTPVSFVLPNAIVAEYIHTYSLIHDDLPCMDDDDFRRGNPTCHKKFGEDMAVLAGDALLSTAFETLSKDMLMYMDDPILLKRKIRAMHSLAKGSGVRGMVSGQIADIKTAQSGCSEEILNYVNYHKTAALIKACVLSGGFLAGMDDDTREDLTVYGENIGMAFQLVDDIEDSRSGQDNDTATYTECFGLERTRELAEKYINKAESAIEKYYDHAEIYMYLAEYLKEKLNE